jgi:hypothetical protein
VAILLGIIVPEVHGILLETAAADAQARLLCLLVCRKQLLGGSLAPLVLVLVGGRP